MTVVKVSAARAELPKLIDAVERGEEVTLTRHGRPVAVLVRPDRLRSRRIEPVAQDAAEIRALLEAARNRPLSPGAQAAPGRAEELIAEVRAGRDKR